VPGTQFGDPETVNYDRTSLQAVFDDTLTLALAAYIFERSDFAGHAVAILRRVCVDEESRMNPRLTCAQLIPGTKTSRSRGIIEAKGFHYFLDGVGLLQHLGAVPTEVLAIFRFWLSAYLNWLRTSYLAVQLTEPEGPGAQIDAFDCNGQMWSTVRLATVFDITMSQGSFPCLRYSWVGRTYMPI
jgi:hypothetical protein